MAEYTRTERRAGSSAAAPRIPTNLLLTIFDGNNQPRTVSLDSFQKDTITFGRLETNDIVLTSGIVSRQHGRFRFHNGQWVIEDIKLYGNQGSRNGLIYNNRSVLTKLLNEGDFIRIDDGIETIPMGVLFVFSSSESANRWSTFDIAGRPEITIGRDNSCDIILPHISVSRVHARITNEGGAYYIQDNGSTNGVVVNNVKITRKTRLHEKDVIFITNSKVIFTSSRISYCCYKSGISVDAENIVITRKRGFKTFVTGNNISLNIRPGELVAIVGGSGAGKSTIMNCISGYLPPTQGSVYINGVDLYQNFESFRNLIGYVPQSDIVYDNLTLYDMLIYASKLRLPKDATREDRENAVERAIEVVQLTEKKKSYIRNLSGGEKKRASIAVELLSDPNLFFLDEPSSGLDPGTERNLMGALRGMADGGKTVILVTHSTLQLRMCDKIVFMGKGGNLCFFGSYEDALRFFQVSDIVDVYDMITDNAEAWRAYYDETVAHSTNIQHTADPVQLQTRKKGFCLPVLCSRYFKLTINDTVRLCIIL